MVEAYEDEAEGRLGRDETGRLAMREVCLRPRVRFAGPAPQAEALAQLHAQAHEACFLAASVRCPVRVQPT